jgi:hypothetical protein
MNTRARPSQTGQTPDPSPRAKKKSERHAKSEADCASNHEAGPRGEENDSRIIVGHHNEAWIDRHDRDVGPAARDDNLAIGSQVSVVVGLFSFPLNRVHYVRLLRQECVSNVGGPPHIGIHHFQH